MYMDVVVHLCQCPGFDICSHGAAMHWYVFLVHHLGKKTCASVRFYACIAILNSWSTACRSNIWWLETLRALAKNGTGLAVEQSEWRMKERRWTPDVIIAKEARMEWECWCHWVLRSYVEKQKFYRAFFVCLRWHKLCLLLLLNCGAEQAIPPWRDGSWTQNWYKPCCTQSL